MSFYAYATRLLRLWRLWVLVLVGIGVVASLGSRNLLAPAARTCPQAPTLGPDVEPQVRERLTRLHELGLLYCGGTQDTFQSLDGLVYWGSDGLVSILFFQLTRPDDVTVTRYVFGSGYPPSPVGDGPAPGLEAVSGEPTTLNQAPAGSPYYYRLDGAPADDDYAITVDLRGTARQNRGLQKRSFWRDLDQLLAIVRHRTLHPEVVTGQARVALPILPDRWRELRAREVNPAFATEKGRASVSRLEAANPLSPTIYQLVNGPLASTVWVAGVVTDTFRAATLAAPDGRLVAPLAVTMWRNSLQRAVVSIAFPAQSAATTYELRLGSPGMGEPTATGPWALPVRFP